MKKNRFVKGVCGFIIAALLLGAGGLFLSENTITANASLNGDLAAIDDALTAVETTEAENAAEIADMDYIVSDDIIIKAVSVDNVSIDAKSYTTGHVEFDHTGYTVKGLVGFYISNASTDGVNRTYCTPSKMCLGSGALAYTIRNRADDVAKIKITGYFLLAKTK